MGQYWVPYLPLGHLSMWTGEARDQTTNIPIGRQFALLSYSRPVLATVFFFLSTDQVAFNMYFSRGMNNMVIGSTEQNIYCK